MKQRLEGAGIMFCLFVFIFFFICDEIEANRKDMNNAVGTVCDWLSDGPPCREILCGLRGK